MSRAYTIVDEPRPGKLAHLSVNPLWPLFAYMVGGPFFSWTWTVINGVAIGSPTLRREIVTVVVGFVLVIGGMLGLQAAMHGGLIGNNRLPYARLLLTTVELAVCYLVFVPQSRAFELYQHYGGKVANGALGLIVAVAVGHRYSAFIFHLVLGGGQ